MALLILAPDPAGPVAPCGPVAPVDPMGPVAPTAELAMVNVPTMAA
jgi:hypothetical protein